MSLEEVKRVIAETFRLGGSYIGGEALHAAARAGNGHPYIVQLIGYEIWNTVRSPSDGVDPASSKKGIAAARSISGEIFVKPVWDTLTPRERDFLTAMLSDEEETAVGDIARRTGMPPKQVSVYRRRLIDGDVILSTRHGYVDFANSATRQWLRKKQDDSHRQKSPLVDSI